MEEKINLVAAMIAASKKTVIFTGAGISTESGIPDFRGPDGLWTKVDPEDFTIDRYLRSGETRKKVWYYLVEGGLMTTSQPNRAHLAIAELERMNKLSSIITQNIDNLHQRAGNDPKKVHELHGNMQWLVCLDCAERYDLEMMRQKHPSPDHFPICEKCAGLLKPGVVFFGEMLPPDTLRMAEQESEKCDLFMVIGSSLVVYPAAYMPLYAKQSGAKIVIVNMGQTGQNDIADVFINAPAGDTLSRIVARLKEIMT
ncbi:MAG TPA: NAD-dependent deacylase [Smithella sp.]|jgi:NAD-dependent deacetylase|nr:NAD-dependent deacylase [Smithella sp.]HNQ65066.1 NAD-dependent deacylase [Smithella sp.]HOE33477.1 NAD-dependent deacylase [Smithella sp.]HOG09366.1 NAD-dependent deacylase [Smithella sp.]HOO34653.1 NAD-dependent deacylase [Smithella sp.]